MIINNSPNANNFFSMVAQLLSNSVIDLFAVDTRGTILTGCVLYRIYHFLCNIDKIRVSHWLGKNAIESKKLVCQIGKSINHNLFVSYKPFATLCIK